MKHFAHSTPSLSLLKRIKQEAKSRSREGGGKHSTELEAVSREAGFSSFENARLACVSGSEANLIKRLLGTIAPDLSHQHHLLILRVKQSELLGLGGASEVHNLEQEERSEFMFSGMKVLKRAWAQAGRDEFFGFSIETDVMKDLRAASSSAPF
ncbi:hypothetical protein HNP46_006744 [Pseudomonas nitritireducens]|uniref:Uncharacterized protein n=1 Tax=Pseudomonas nitroreducens TaxID=46680 RepID=A0A7W7KSN7_PSENT|nr:hypothetical protein [Pseudomonas nitritireducens]MBB4867825.1 hypothetical protein [Pseudomonas nitritireducens]